MFIRQAPADQTLFGRDLASITSACRKMQDGPLETAEKQELLEKIEFVINCMKSGNVPRGFASQKATDFIVGSLGTVMNLIKAYEIEEAKDEKRMPQTRNRSNTIVDAAIESPKPRR